MCVCVCFSYFYALLAGGGGYKWFVPLLCNIMAAICCYCWNHYKYLFIAVVIPHCQKERRLKNGDRGQKGVGEWVGGGDENYNY